MHNSNKLIIIPRQKKPKVIIKVIFKNSLAIDLFKTNDLSILFFQVFIFLLIIVSLMNYLFSKDNKYDYLADPHTATGLYVLSQMNNHYPTISLACAHPAKFDNVIVKATNKRPSMPEKLKNIFDLNEKMTILDNDANLVKSHILTLI